MGISLMELFKSIVTSLLDRIVIEEANNIMEVAKIVAQSIKNGGILHVIGASHSAYSCGSAIL